MKVKEVVEWEILEKANRERILDYYKKARKMSWKYHNKKLKVYYPSSNFPSISVTGNKCEQNCKYCNKQYLKNMISITKPDQLLKFALELNTKGAKGFLLSGGYTKESTVPLEPFIDTVAKIKQKTDLKINVHSGLINYELAIKLKKAGIDSVSLDVITDDKVISEILQTNKKGTDYINSYLDIVKAKLNVVPHICLGLYYGKIKGNIDAINKIMKYNPKQIVFLGFIPTKGTEMENSEIIEPELFAKILLYSRFLNPKTEQSLGCMRVRLPAYEMLAVDAGINRIAVAKKKTIAYAKNNYKLKVIEKEYCCAI